MNSKIIVLILAIISSLISFFIGINAYNNLSSSFFFSPERDMPFIRRYIFLGIVLLIFVVIKYLSKGIVSNLLATVIIFLCYLSDNGYYKLIVFYYSFLQVLDSGDFLFITRFVIEIIKSSLIIGLLLYQIIYVIILIVHKFRKPLSDEK